jgi:hypothetical protein
MAKKRPSGASASETDLAGSRRSGRSGTPLAILESSFSCTVAPATKLTWGGARNRADRESFGLSDKQVAELIEAAGFALATGRTFQRHWIVHYGKAGIAERDGARFVGHMLDLLRRQAKRAGGEMTALWVREWASSLGGHVHVLLHLPDGFSMRNRTTRLVKAAGGRCVPGVTRIKHIGGRLARSPSGAVHQRANAALVVRYILKAASEETGARLDLKYSGRRGRIIGLRYGSTHSIKPAARRRAGFAKVVKSSDCGCDE